MIPPILSTESLLRAGISTPGTRQLERLEEQRLDDEAVDDLSTAIEERHHLSPTQGQDSPEKQQFREKWRHIYRKMREHEDAIKTTGRIYRKRGGEKPQYALKFREGQNGCSVRRSVHVGDGTLLVLVAGVLLSWKTEGAGASSNTEHPEASEAPEASNPAAEP